MSKKALPLVIVLLAIASFLAGSFYTRSTVQKPQKEEQPQGEAAGVQTKEEKDASDPLSLENLKIYAKELKLDQDKFEKCLSDNIYGQKLIDDTNYAASFGVNATPTFFINGKLLIGAADLTIFKEIIDKEINDTASNNSQDYSQKLQEIADQKAFNPNPDKKPEIKKDTPVKGPQNAPVTIIEFSDPGCPACAYAHTKVLSKLFSEYKNNIRFAFYYLPTHAGSDNATKAMFCAADQDNFWQYYDRVFQQSAQVYGL